ncbi:S41 family peptidase [Streptomyces sp. ZYX-F-203]
MSGRDLFRPPRHVRHGGSLTLAFVGVLVTGAATGSPVEAPPGASSDRPGHVAPAPHHAEVARAAAEAMAAGGSPVEAAERAVGRSGDRWGAVYSRSEYRELAEALDGRYTGVGIAARRGRGGAVEVARVRPDSPAADAGIVAGDRLRGVDGRSVDGVPVTEVVARLRGDSVRDPAGTEVSLELERGTRVWTETVRRATVTTRPVTTRDLDGGATLVRVASFTRGAGEQVRAAVRDAPEEAGIVLDLRGNSGGLVAEAVETASVFLDGGLVATYDVDGSERALHAETGGDTARPLVALVDGGTMSAAELLAGALRDRGRAVVLGARTFGKGAVQMPSALPDGSTAELTVGHYRTPAGHGVDGVGLTPDLETDTSDEATLRRAETVLDGLGRDDSAPRPRPAT